MFKRPDEVRTDIRLFASFAFFGIVASGLDFVIYGSLIWANSDPILSNLISSSVGILINFFLVSNYTFGVDYKNLRNLILFFIVAIGVLILSSILLAFLIKLFDVYPLIAKLITLPLSAIIKYLINLRYIFI